MLRGNKKTHVIEMIPCGRVCVSGYMRGVDVWADVWLGDGVRYVALAKAC